MHNLQQAIDGEDSLLAGLIVAHSFGPDFDIQHYLVELESLAESCQLNPSSDVPDDQRFEQLLHTFYRQMAFSGATGDKLSSSYSLLNHVVDYRTGIPVTLAVVFCHIAKLCDLSVQGVNFPGHYLLRYEREGKSPWYIEPLSGQKLNQAELLRLYLSVMDDGEDELPDEVLAPASTLETTVRLLNNLKLAFIEEEKFHQALACVNLLVQLRPDDPYERRDRGFLLHQLDCPQVALADYQYFIKHCPQDPAAQLLKIQLRHFDSLPVVLH